MWNWFAGIFDGLFRALEAVGGLLSGLVAGFAELFVQAWSVLSLLVQILWQFANLLTGLVGGLLATLRSITSPEYDWGPAQPGAAAFGTALRLDVLGWLIAAIVWLIVAVCVLRALAHD